MDRASGGGCSPVSEEISSFAIGEISGTLSETYGFYGFLLDLIEFSTPYPDINSPEAVVLYWIYHDLSISAAEKMGLITSPTASGAGPLMIGSKTGGTSIEAQ